MLNCVFWPLTSDIVRRWLDLSQLVMYTNFLACTHAVGAMLAISAIESVAKIEPTITMKYDHIVPAVPPLESGTRSPMIVSTHPLPKSKE